MGRRDVNLDLQGIGSTHVPAEAMWSIGCGRWAGTRPAPTLGRLANIHIGRRDVNLDLQGIGSTSVVPLGLCGPLVVGVGQAQDLPLH